MDGLRALDASLRSPAQPLVTQNYRFLGFVNDVGEALHAFLPRSLYLGSYAVTGAYALAAVYYDRACLGDRLAAAGAAPSDAAARLNARTADNAAWHALATVAITPLVVIPAVKAGAVRAFRALAPGLAPALRDKALPAAVAILAIPAVVSPVDNATTAAFNAVPGLRAAPEPYHWTGYWEALNEPHAAGGDAHAAPAPAPAAGAAKPAPPAKKMH